MKNLRKATLALLLTLLAAVVISGIGTSVVSLVWGDGGHEGIQTTVLDLMMGYDVSYSNVTETWQLDSPNDWMTSSETSHNAYISQWWWAKEWGWPDNKAMRLVAKYDFWVWDVLALGLLAFVTWGTGLPPLPPTEQETT